MSAFLAQCYCGHGGWRLSLDKIYFVLLMVNGNLHAQKWHGEKLNLETKKNHEYLKRWELTEEESKLSIMELIQKYPLE